MKKFCLGLCIAIALSLNSCAPMPASQGWPVTSYSYNCVSMPRQPACLISIDGFKYPEEFAACRQSMDNFSRAVSGYYECTGAELSQIFDKLLVDVPQTYNCLAENDGDSSKCKLVSEPRFTKSYEADGIGIYFGIPACVREGKLGSGIQGCKESVEVFTGQKSYGGDAFVEPVQQQYDSFMKNLNEKIESELDDAINKFNCLAERRDFCI